MSMQETIFFRNNKRYDFNFLAEDVSSDGGIFLIEKVEKKYCVIKNFCKQLPDLRHKSYVTHGVEALMRQRVFFMTLGYDDCNDEKYLKNDPVIKEALSSTLASQSTLSRFENSLTIKDIYNLSLFMIDTYVSSISPKRKTIIIDVDGTDDRTHGKQQLSMFNGYYNHTIYNELLFHDGDTGQIILAALRAGNSHSNRWFCRLLEIIVKKIRSKHPGIQIQLRGDAGFSGSKFYKLAKELEIEYCVGMTKNERLKQITASLENHVRVNYVDKGIKYRTFTEEFIYKAESWEEPQKCYAKVESTGKGINIRFFCSNMETESAETLYTEFYVKRGEHSENRIKELKNMCYSDRLSCHKYTANAFRLLMSCLCYELFRLIKEGIKQINSKEAIKWQIDNIRLFLLKVGTQIKVRVRRVIISFSKSYLCQDIFRRLIQVF